RVSLGLRKNSLRPERDLLGFDHASDFSAITEGVIGRSCRRRKLGHRRSCEPACVRLLTGWGGLPASRLKTGIYSSRSGSKLGFWSLRHSLISFWANKVNAGRFALGTRLNEDIGLTSNVAFACGSV